MTTWVDRAEQRLANARETQGLNIHDFEWIHLGHKIETLSLTLNSDKVDPTSSDPLPASAIQEICHTCKDVRGLDVKSAIETSPVRIG